MIKTSKINFTQGQCLTVMRMKMKKGQKSRQLTGTKRKTQTMSVTKLLGYGKWRREENRLTT